MLIFIPNGHRRTVTFHEVTNLHPEFSFTHLPYRGEEAGEAFAGCLGTGNALDKGKLRDAILGRLVSWSLGRPMDAAALRDLASPIFEKIESTIFGRRAGDAVFEEGDEEEEEKVA